MLNTESQDPGVTDLNLCNFTAITSMPADTETIDTTMLRRKSTAPLPHVTSDYVFETRQTTKSHSATDSSSNYANPTTTTADAQQITSGTANLDPLFREFIVIRANQKKFPAKFQQLTYFISNQIT